MKTSLQRFLFTFAFLLTAAARAETNQPSLVVVVSIDQFRYDYLERFRPFFGAAGFNLLLERGANFADCHHTHSHTKTGPGHAVMLTGVCANLNGIVANDWIDRATFERVSCVGDTDVQIIGLPPPTGPRASGIYDPYLGRSPRNLLAATVGDELKITHGGRPKVIGISNKDRAAILMSGRLANAAYFMEEGRMVSSTYYMGELPAWVRAWNAAKKADAYFGQVWDRVLPAEAYAIQGPDAMAGEDTTVDQLGNTLPKTVTGGETAPGAKFYDAFENTPFSNEVLADFAETAIAQEKLGTRAGITDLLCLSFSANDHIGHLWGPDSHEIMDNVVRMDRTLAEFFAFLDRTIGLAHCTIVLTADHGASSTPEHIHALNPNVPAGRIDGAQLIAACEAALNRAFGPLQGGGRWVVRDDGYFLLRPAALAEKKIESAAAQGVVRDALLALDFVQAAYTRVELERGDVHDELGRQALLSFNRERGGDVYFQAKPNFFSKATGTNHSTPYNYDTHVPLVWFGVGVKPGVYVQRVHVSDLAPTLSHLLGIPAPPLANGRVLF
jgi:hypothetical protein